MPVQLPHQIQGCPTILRLSQSHQRSLAIIKIIKPDPQTIVNDEYHEFLQLMSESESNKLAPRRKYEHKIVWKEGVEAQFPPSYGMGR